MPNFHAFWRNYAPQAKVLRLGILSPDQKRDFFAAIDVFALPSRSDSFGIVLLEAWVNGVPNVGYRAGGIAGVIRHAEDGLLVRCGDVNGLADALDQLAKNEGLRRRLGAAGKEKTLRDFRWQDKLALVRAVYEEVTGRSRLSKMEAFPHVKKTVSQCGASFQLAGMHGKLEACPTLGESA